MEFIQNLNWGDFQVWAKDKYPDEDPSGCWVGSEYVIHKLNSKDVNFMNVKSIVPSVIHDGWTHCFVENDFEMHHFSLFVDEKENSIIVIQTYGGIYEIQKNHYVFTEWISMLEKALTGEGKAWRYIFNIPIQYKIPRRIGNGILCMFI